MELRLESGKTIRDPSALAIAEALRGHVQSGGGFAILERDEQTYIQAAGDGEAGFVLEYQDGDTEQHFRATRERISLSEVTKALSSYAAGDGAWKGMFEWARLDESGFEAKKGCLGAVVMLVAAGGAGVAGLCVLLASLVAH